MGIPQKVQQGIKVGLGNSTAPNGSENIQSSKTLQRDVHFRIIHNRQKVQQHKCPSTIYRQNVVYPQNPILFSHEEEWSTDPSYTIDEPWSRTLSERSGHPSGPALSGLNSRMSRRGKFMETECGWVADTDWEERGTGDCFLRTGVEDKLKQWCQLHIIVNPVKYSYIICFKMA